MAAEAQGTSSRSSIAWEEEIVEGGECKMPELMDREPAALFVVSDGSGYSAGGAVNLALKQFENQSTKNCETVQVSS